MKNMKFWRTALVATLVLTVMLSVTGGTIAWFTDSVESTANVIQAGNLDVDVHVDGEISIQDVHTLFNDVALWEPGAVAWENLTVVNEGNLALKYEMTINAANENDLNGNKLSDVLQVGVVAGGVENADRNTVIGQVNEWKSFAEYKAEGALLPVDSTLTVEGAAKGSQNYGVVIYWKPTAEDNKWNANNGQQTSDGQPLHIDLGIKLQATQLMAESDSFGSDYDADATDAIFGDEAIKEEDPNINAYSVYNAAQLADLNAKMANKSAGRNVVINIMADIDFSGYTWTPVDSHADTAFTMKEINGNGHTISNMTINGQAMFTRFAGTGDVVIKDITFDNATVNSTKLNSSILTVQSYQNVLLDNVDVKNSSITGAYKVAPLIATVYNEVSSTVTATLKNCDVSNVTVEATTYDFCTAGMVAFVNAGDNDKIEFENCTVSDVKLIAPDDSYNAHAFVYTAGSETLYDEAEGVTVTNCQVLTGVADGLVKDAAGNYYVSNANGLMAFRNTIGTWGSDTLAGKTINLMDDIDATGKTWETAVIASGSASRNGFTFNGNGYTISNLTIVKNSENATPGTGLFAMNSGNNTPTTFKDITFDNVTVNGSHHTGVLWGQMYGKIVVENVNVVNSNVTGTCNVGGLIGRNGDDSASQITFKNCAVKNTKVTATGTTSTDDKAGASAFLGMALKVAVNDVGVNLEFVGNNISEGNTLTSADGYQGGGIYAISAWGEESWTAPTVVNAFTNYNN